MSDEVALGVRVVALGVMLALGGTYHYFATNKKDLINVRVRDKYTRRRWVSNGKGGGHYKTDYFIETEDHGTISDNALIYEGEFIPGDEYDDVEIGRMYDMKVSHDKLFNSNNVLKITKTHAEPHW